MATEQYYKWYSPTLSLETEMLTYGDRGTPLILFPTTKGSHHQNTDFGLVASAMPFVEAGLIKIYCVDSVDAYSFYNKAIPPHERIRNHVYWDKFILEEIAQRACSDTGTRRIMVGGCSFGGYHAANFAFRYPWLVSNMMSMGGAFDIRDFMHGYSDDHVYFNNPIDFMSNMNDGGLISQFHNMGIVLGTGENDICRADNYQMSGILNSKGINHWLDDRPGVGHDWPWWGDMMYTYLKVIFEGR